MNLNDKLLMLSIKVRTMLLDEHGQDLVEYALLVAIVALGATAGMHSIASDINAAFTKVGSNLTSAVAGS